MLVIYSYFFPKFFRKPLSTNLFFAHLESSVLSTCKHCFKSFVYLNQDEFKLVKNHILVKSLDELLFLHHASLENADIFDSYIFKLIWHPCMKMCLQ